jgi:hypothetical protein
MSRIHLVAVLVSSLLIGCGKAEPTVVKRGEYPTVREEALKGIVRTKFDSPNPTEAQLARRARNIAIIKKMGLPTNDNLPVVEDESVVKLRSPEEVAKRCLATSFCAVRGEANDKAFVPGGKGVHCRSRSQKAAAR